MPEVSETQLHSWMMDGKYPPHYDDYGHPAYHQKLERYALATLSRDIRYQETIIQKVAPQKPQARKGFRQPPNNRTRATKNRVGRPQPTEVEVRVNRTLDKGSQVKVVMASRMGDVGITPRLDATRGYVVRINCIEGEWDVMGDGKTIINLKPEGVLVDIKPIEDPHADQVALCFPEGCKEPHQYEEDE